METKFKRTILSAGMQQSNLETTKLRKRIIEGNWKSATENLYFGAMGTVTQNTGKTDAIMFEQLQEMADKLKAIPEPKHKLGLSRFYGLTVKIQAIQALRKVAT